MLYAQQCEVCHKKIEGNYIEHTAGFPERAHVLCSVKCLRLFLRMEDDQLEYEKSIVKEIDKKK
ncbi:hypothetical protein D0466_00240 [Peribacillus glennii]|uniref:MYM-type domain-containing protein n=1 Tax=Peribacillus glennii TaxID=2303991 RepID=A0A372LKG4_9BACI|nr:hypothetical protein D0466_00240 [Peribacillus glennii]